MAHNLLAKSSPDDQLIIHDANPATTARFVQDMKDRGLLNRASASVQPRLTVADSAKVAAATASTIVTVLPSPVVVHAVFSALAESLAPNFSRLVLDCSTIDPATSRGCAQTFTAKDLGRFIDTPMSGGVVGAAAGTLTFMIGYPPESTATAQEEATAQQRILPVLKTMGKKIWRLGDQGAGLAGKLANNYLLALCNIATCEAMHLGVSLGLEPALLGDVVNSSSGRNWVSENNNPLPGIVSVSGGKEGGGGVLSPADRGYAPGFTVELMKKDLKLAIAAAREASVALELAAKAEEVYSATEARYPRKDFSVVYRYLQERRM